MYFYSIIKYQQDNSIRLGINAKKIFTYITVTYLRNKYVDEERISKMHDHEQFSNLYVHLIAKRTLLYICIQRIVHFQRMTTRELMNGYMLHCSINMYLVLIIALYEL